MFHFKIAELPHFTCYSVDLGFSFAFAIFIYLYMPEKNSAKLYFAILSLVPIFGFFTPGTTDIWDQICCEGAIL